MLTGTVKAKIVEIRFAYGGKVSSIHKNVGDKVKKWEAVASLDRKILQTELDKELADYEKVRADFEIYALANKEPVTELQKYLRQEKQASLNASVKNVEIAKAKIDQSDLFSPVDGIILDNSNIVPGLYITPSNSTIKIVDITSYYLELIIEQKQIVEFMEPKKCNVEIIESNQIEVVSLPVITDGKNFIVKIPLPDSKNLLIGLEGRANF